MFCFSAFYFFFFERLTKELSLAFEYTTQKKIKKNCGKHEHMVRRKKRVRKKKISKILYEEIKKCKGK